jgi:glycosyltransferase involved in cell wall biosynthesis
MSAPTTILCYDDNPDYGGHQVMACLAVEALASSPDWRPVFFCTPDNRRLTERLEEIRAATGNLEIRPSPFSTRKLQGLRNRFSTASISSLRLLFGQENPDLILCIQGEIEDGSLALCAAETLHTPCISYIPVPHRMAHMGAKLGAVRDALNTYLFKKPDGWITISESMKSLLEERGAGAPIAVVHNGIDLTRFAAGDSAAARRVLGLPSGQTLLGCIGRIEFNQKQQDFLVRTFSDGWTAEEAVRLVITGDGPDRTRLETLLRDLGLSERVILLPWQADSALVYKALDLLIIPSRFEGVPLVMLEALACGTPVIGSNRDGMKDLLPPEWTFETENSHALIQTARSVLAADSSALPEALQQRILNEFGVTRFQEDFKTALHRFLNVDAASP